MIFHPKIVDATLFYLTLYKIQITIYIFFQLYIYSFSFIYLFTASYILNKSFIASYIFLQLLTVSYSFLQLFLYLSLPLVTVAYSSLQLIYSSYSFLQLLIASYNFLHFPTTYSCILQLNRTGRCNFLPTHHNKQSFPCSKYSLLGLHHPSPPTFCCLYPMTIYQIFETLSILCIFLLP